MADMRIKGRTVCLDPHPDVAMVGTIPYPASIRGRNVLFPDPDVVSGGVIPFPATIRGKNVLFPVCYGLEFDVVVDDDNNFLVDSDNVCIAISIRRDYGEEKDELIVSTDTIWLTPQNGNMEQFTIKTKKDWHIV